MNYNLNKFDWAKLCHCFCVHVQVVIVKTSEELYQYIKQRNLTIDFGGTLQHDFRAWQAVQKVNFER
jgi:phosphate-selective porin